VSPLYRIDVGKMMSNQSLRLVPRALSAFVVLSCGDAIYNWNACCYAIWYSYGFKYMD